MRRAALGPGSGLRPDLSSACALALAGACALAPTHVHANDVVPKTTVIVGTLATWTVAGLTGHPLDCLAEGPAPHGGTDGWGGRVEGFKDKELKYASFGVVRRDCHVSRVAGFDLDVAPVVSVGYWHASSVAQPGPAYPDIATPGHTSAWDLSLVPMFHWKLPVGGGVLLDTEVGIGPAVLSTPEIGLRRKSTNFQFSDHLGIGLASADGHWRAMLAYRHVSNADIAKPNNAVDFAGVALEWKP